MKIGLVVNPWAGVGGSVALKGSDGKAVREEALKRGAIPLANTKTETMLKAFNNALTHKNRTQWFTGPTDMGENALANSHITPTLIAPLTMPTQTETEHTEQLTQWLIQQEVDVIVFAGGDGTARDIYRITDGKLPVLGIPAGVKIHSGVFAVTAHAAGEVLAGLVDGRVTDLRVEEVRDIDEDAFREDIVRTRYFGEMPVPMLGEYMQHTKIGGTQDDGLVLSDIADWLAEQMDDDTCYFVGSGKSTATLMAHLDLPNTLLGVDAVYQSKVIKPDCTAADLRELLNQFTCQAIVSVIGGQGHIFGRGNAQFSPDVLRTLGKERLRIIGTKGKLKALNGRPFLLDTSDPALDQEWSGLIPVITGYNDQAIYPVGTQ